MWLSSGKLQCRRTGRLTWVKVVSINFDLFHRFHGGNELELLLESWTLSVSPLLSIVSEVPPFWIAVSLKLRTLSLSLIWPMTISRMAFGPNAHCGKMYLDESFTQLFHKIIKLYNFINWPCFFNFCNYHFLSVIKHKQSKTLKTLTSAPHHPHTVDQKDVFNNLIRHASVSWLIKQFIAKKRLFKFEQ